MVERIGADVRVFPQPVKLTCADMIIFDELILGNSFFLHSFPKGVIYDHVQNTSIFPFRV